MNVKVTFRLDGAGLYFDRNEPIHLDALLAWAVASRYQQGLTRDNTPERVPLPLAETEINGVRLWCASALEPTGPTGEGLAYWRKRFRAARAEVSKGSPNLTNGTYRDWNMPVPLLLCHEMVAYARTSAGRQGHVDGRRGNRGSGHELRRLLRTVTHLGRKRAHGWGKVVEVTVEPVEEDRSLAWEGRATRWLPDPSGIRLVRPIPPYWHPQGRIRCCEVGSPYPHLEAH